MAEVSSGKDARDASSAPDLLVDALEGRWWARSPASARRGRPLWRAPRAWRCSSSRPGQPRQDNLPPSTTSPDRSRELVSGSGLCFIVFCRVISGGGFAGWVVLGARVGVVRLVGAVLWRWSGCGGVRGESFGGGWGRRGVAGVYGAPGLQACSSCAVAGRQSSRRRVHFLEERTSRAGACHSCHLRRLGAA